jgi:uncharacterized protein
MRVAVTGSSGFIGSALVDACERAGHDVVRVVRSGPFGADRILWDPERGTIDAAGLAGIDAAVHLAGESIGAKRWTAKQKHRILASRENGTRLLSETMAAMQPRPATLISGSAIGYYGDRGDEVLTESSSSGDGFLAEVVRRWENATSPASGAGIRTVRVRTGLVLGQGGLLARLLLPSKLGLGARLGTGRQWMSWISLRDHVAAILHLLDSDVSGAVNLTAPVPVTNAAFTAALGSVLKRPARLVVPNAAIALAFGSELAADLLSSLRVLPTRLEGDGFAFRDLDVAAALTWAVGKA